MIKLRQMLKEGPLDEKLAGEWTSKSGQWKVKIFLRPPYGRADARVEVWHARGSASMPERSVVKPSVNSAKAFARRYLKEDKSSAAEEAKKRGLKHVGWGRYSDPSTGNVVAKVENGRLVRLQKPEPPGPPKQKGPKSPELKKEPGTQKPEAPQVEKKPEGDYIQQHQQSDIPKIPKQARKYVSMRIDKLADAVKRAREAGETPPDFNLCQITIPGTNLYCDDNLGIPRSQMPQFKGKPQPGTKAEKMPKDKSGEVDTEPMFREMLKKHGVDVTDTTIPSDQLKATQRELVGAKVAGMTKALEKDPNIPGLVAPIYVSNDGYVIDGHHRWAAITSAAVAKGEPAEMKVHVIDMPARQIIPLANKFAEKTGVSTKKAAPTEGVGMIKLVDVLSEATAVGKAQKAILQHLQQGLRGQQSKRYEVGLSDMARRPEFRGIHFKAIQSAAKALAKKGLIWYDGCCNVRLEDD